MSVCFNEPNFKSTETKCLKIWVSRAWEKKANSAITSLDFHFWHRRQYLAFHESPSLRGGILISKWQMKITHCWDNKGELGFSRQSPKREQGRLNAATRLFGCYFTQVQHTKSSLLITRLKRMSIASWKHFSRWRVLFLPGELTKMPYGSASLKRHI